ncbi:MAG: electron transport complex subunit RsxC [Planctomycetes bacterium]|nr:electron transport complex subunit RsxC [Planctomycetota bacterium]
MMHRFSGGVHPPETKDETFALPIEDFPPPEVLVVPLAQHIGAPAAPGVCAGDEVLKGTVLGEPAGFVSAAIHSPVSGRVAAVEEHLGPLGRKTLSVILENDGREAWADGCNVERDISGLDAGAVRDIVRNGGLVGMGGATFPTHVKLSPPENKPIDTLIVNGAECEPYLTADHRLMLEEAEKIVLGADLARRAAGAAKIVFALEANKPDAFEALQKASADLADAEVVMFATRYPQGAEKQLIQAVTGRQVPSGGLPMDAGVLVQNVATCAAVYDACRFGRPLIERITTVTGPCTVSPANFRVRVGTLYAELLWKVGITGTPRRLIMGGPMMGIAQRSADIPVTKGTSGLVVLDEVPSEDFGACIRCGKCVRACPVSLVPSQLGVLLEAGRLDDAVLMDLADCIECGCCTYVCPSKRPIVNWIKFGKAQIAERRTRERKAEK